MDYGVSYSSGTDDYLSQLHLNGISRGRSAGNGRTALGSATFSEMFTDMETQIHILEQEAYSAILRAFKAQADAISWEKEGLITELRKELRVSDDEHRELLTKVNGDELIRRIREWRQAGAHQNARFGVSQSVHDGLTSPMSNVRKRQKTSQAISGQQGLTVIASQLHRGSSGAVQHEPAGITTYNPLVGRRVLTRWPADNNFYEALITKYNPAEDLHFLVYDINTEKETWEWVNLKEIPPDDIRWEGEDPFRSGHGDLISDVSRMRVSTKDQFKRQFLSVQNGFPRRVSDDIELLNTETLVKEVEKVFGVSRPDPLELEKAKKMLKEHEQALIEAIARLADASDGDSDGEQRFLHRHAMEG